MRARHRIYHVECFQCVVCQRQLVAGDEFCQRGDDDLVCKDDFDAVVDCRADTSTGGSSVTTAGFSPFDDSAAHEHNNNNNKSSKEFEKSASLLGG